MKHINYFKNFLETTVNMPKAKLDLLSQRVDTVYGVLKADDDRADSGIVHQNIDRQPHARDRVEQHGAGLGVGHVAPDHLDPHAVAEFGGELTQLVHSARNQGDAVPTSGQFAGDVSADSRRRTRYNGGAGG